MLFVILYCMRHTKTNVFPVQIMFRLLAVNIPFDVEVSLLLYDPFHRNMQIRKFYLYFLELLVLACLYFYFLLCTITLQKQTPAGFDMCYIYVVACTNECLSPCPVYTVTKAFMQGFSCWWIIVRHICFILVSFPLKVILGG